MPVLVSFGVHARSIKGNWLYVKDEMFEVDAEIGTLRVLITCSNNLTLFRLQARANQLYNAGYKTLAHLANANPETLVKTIEHLSRRQAKQIVSSAKVSK